PDDGHTSLIWTESLGGVVTQPMTDGSRLGLNIPGLTLVLLDSRSGVPAQPFPLNRQSDGKAREWIGQKLAARGIDPKALDSPSPYELPLHSIAKGVAYDAEGNADGLTKLCCWFANAAISLAPLRQRMGERKLTASPVRCWPHHFDLATLISFSAKASG